MYKKSSSHDDPKTEPLTKKAPARLRTFLKFLWAQKGKLNGSQLNIYPAKSDQNRETYCQRNPGTHPPTQLKTLPFCHFRPNYDELNLHNGT